MHTRLVLYVHLHWKIMKNLRDLAAYLRFCSFRKLHRIEINKISISDAVQRVKAETFVPPRLGDDAA
ncbi:MAG: hypothetical protein BGP17_04040 [Sphingomonas sp. 67-41]|nr:MAG: hypothetical protein BGP17_04040 [Sphingomonas sp. 67-41]